MSPVSAWASKWMTEIRPAPWCRDTPVTSGQVTVWSPPRISGIAPFAAMKATASSMVWQLLWISPE